MEKPATYWNDRFSTILAGCWDSSWPDPRTGLENHLRDDPEYKALDSFGKRRVRAILDRFLKH